MMVGVIMPHAGSRALSQPASPSFREDPMPDSKLVEYLTAWGEMAEQCPEAILMSDLLPLIGVLKDSLFIRDARAALNGEGRPVIVFNTPAMSLLDGVVPTSPGRPIAILSDRRRSDSPSYLTYALEPDRVADIRLAELGGFVLGVLPGHRMQGQPADVVMMFGRAHVPIRPN
jgi:hypothetical protein